VEAEWRSHAAQLVPHHDQPLLVMGDVMSDENLSADPPELDQSSPDLVASLQAAEAPAAEPTEPAAPSVEPLPSEPDAAEPDVPAAAEPNVGDDEATKLTRFIDDGLGSKFKDKYENDAATITGLVEASRAIGRRDADAEYGRAVRQHETAFQQFLQQQGQQQQGQGQPQQPQQQPIQPPSLSLEERQREIRQWQEIVAREGDNAPADVRRNLSQATDKIQGAAIEMAFHRDKIVAEAAEAARQAATEVATQTTQQITQQQQATSQEQQQLSGFDQTHQGWMYQDVARPHTQDNLTADGQMLVQTAGALRAQAQQAGRPIADSQALEWARLMLVDQRVKQQQAQQAQVQPVQPVKPAAQRQPAVAAPAGGNPEEEYRQDMANIGTDKAMGLGELLTKWTGQREAVANQTS